MTIITADIIYLCMVWMDRCHALAAWACTTHLNHGTCNMHLYVPCTCTIPLLHALVPFTCILSNLSPCMCFFNDKPTMWSSSVWYIGHIIVRCTSRFLRIRQVMVNSIKGMVQGHSASGWCKWTVQVHGASGRCKWMVQVNGASARCKWMVRVNGGSAWCKWTVQLHGASAGCKWMVQVHGTSEWCKCMVQVHGTSRWCKWMVQMQVASASSKWMVQLDGAMSIS